MYINEEFLNVQMRCDPSMAFLLTSRKKRCLLLLLQLLRFENRYLKPSRFRKTRLPTLRGNYSACVEAVTPSCLNQILVLVCFSPVCIFKVCFIAHCQLYKNPSLPPSLPLSLSMSDPSRSHHSHCHAWGPSTSAGRAPDIHW